MRFLTKPVRNLLLATVFGAATVLVETEPVLATYPDCFDVASDCVNAHHNNIFIIDDDQQTCYFNMVLEGWECWRMTSETTGWLDSSGQCYAINPSTGYEYCEY